MMTSPPLWNKAREACAKIMEKAQTATPFPQQRCNEALLMLNPTQSRCVKAMLEKRISIQHSLL
jgi:hypothetical protein